MATLEKIRSKSGLLIVVIGLALLAFIVGDAITNSRNIFGDQTTVAKIGSRKIDYTDYVRKREELNARLEQARQQNPAQYANFDTQTLSQMALDELVNDALLDQGVENAGIQTSGNQLRFYVIENPINMRIRDIMQQLNAVGFAVATPEQAYEIIFNPARNGSTDAQMAPFQRAWVAMEQETAQMVKRQTYQRLLTGTVKANKLDKQAIYNDFVNTRDVDIAFHPYGKLNPEEYVVEEVALRNEYENVKNRFKVNEPTKDIAFIAVNVRPSMEDINNSKKLAARTLVSLRKGQIDKDLRKEGIMSTHMELRASDLPRGAVGDFVKSASPDSVRIVTDNSRGFTIVKMGKKTTENDSIQLNIVNVAGGTLPGRVLASLNGGLSVDSLASVYSPDSVVLAQKEQWIALFNNEGRTGVIEESQLDTLLSAGGKYVEIASSPQMAILAKVTGKSEKPKEIYSYEEVNYDLKPSVATIDAERIRLEQYIENNPGLQAFMDNASTEGYAVQNLSVSSSSPAVPRGKNMQSYYPESRQVVRWVMMDGKPGQVGHLYEVSDAMSPAIYAVAVINEYDDYAPLSNEEVNNYVTDRVRKSMAADKLMETYQPKSGTLAGVAQAMNVEPVNNSNFRFGYNPQVRDAAVVGQISGSNPGKVILVRGDNGIYAYQVKGTVNNSESMKYNDSQYQQQYFQMVNPNLNEMLKGASHLKNNIYKFEAGD